MITELLLIFNVCSIHVKILSNEDDTTFNELELNYKYTGISITEKKPSNSVKLISKNAK